ncbi:MAG: hypothetical protein RQ752_09430 [Thermohalobaculum sp.]|nr:hypothetical protein [Thermohalobaculum sp.]
MFGDCAAPPPVSAAAVLTGLAIDPNATIPYREEVHHDALPAPETASGTMHVAPDGWLVKAQARPRVEISEVGEDVVSLRDAPETERNLLPIPPEARPVLEALRAVMSGNLALLAERFAPALVSDTSLWRVRLAVHQTPDVLPVILIGCGAVLRGIEINEPGGIRRLIAFGTAR